MIKAKTRLIIPKNKGNTGLIYIPADVVKDSLFPLRPNETIQVRIEGERLVIENENTLKNEA